MSLSITDNAPMATTALPRGWKWARLGDVCRLNPSRPSGLSKPPGTPTSFVPMAAVDAEEGTILEPETRPFAEVSKGYTYFEEGDVLFAKITPCMQNGKHAVARGLLDGFGFGTTEFHVLRPSDQVLPDWVHLYLRQPKVLFEATKSFTGAVGQQRVPPGFLSSLTIPLPSLAEQKGIVSTVNQQLSAVEKSRRACEEQLEVAKALPAAYLRSVFDSPGAGEWATTKLGDAGEVVSGITLGRAVPNEITRAIPYLRVANVKDGYLDLEDVYEIEATEAEIERLRLRQGDILLTEGGDPDKLGRGTFWECQLAECIHQNHIFRVRLDLDRFSPGFVSAQIGSAYGKRYFLAHAKQTTGIATINQKVLRNFPLMCPSLVTQEEVLRGILQRTADAVRLVETSCAQLHALGTLPSAILRKAFNGEL